MTPPKQYSQKLDIGMRKKKKKKELPCAKISHTVHLALDPIRTVKLNYRERFH
uniref:Uncharacterized protein n=1 Tax=Rhizophora mucronata TaxID=61149 RepID=A0A2P2P6W7_RHIMU